MIVDTIVAVISGYLLGSIPFAYIAGRLIKRVDIRQVGGRNMGALNVMREVGMVAGYAVWLADVGKGVLAVYIARWLGLDMVWVLVAGFAAVAGHNWPIFLRFRGGRGGATTMGVLLALVPREFGMSFGVTAIVVMITSNPVLGLTVGLVFLPLFIWLFTGQIEFVIYSLGLAVFLGVRYLLLGLRRAKSGVDIKKGLIFSRDYNFWQTKKRS